MLCISLVGCGCINKNHVDAIGLLQQERKTKPMGACDLVQQGAETVASRSSMNGGPPKSVALSSTKSNLDSLLILISWATTWSRPTPTLPASTASAISPTIAMLLKSWVVEQLFFFSRFAKSLGRVAFMLRNVFLFIFYVNDNAKPISHIIGTHSSRYSNFLLKYHKTLYDVLYMVNPTGRCAIKTLFGKTYINHKAVSGLVFA